LPTTPRAAAVSRIRLIKAGSPSLPLSRGMTLLDLLLVIVITGILATMAIPRINAYLSDTKLNEAAAELTSGFQYAGNLAVYHQRPFGVKTDAGGNWFRVFDVRYATDSTAHSDSVPPVAPNGVVLNPYDKTWYIKNFSDEPFTGAVLETTGEIRFYPDGHSAAENSSFSVRMGGSRKTITVDGMTGRISAS
jgi:Tfp pilus assembly protein FimT